MEVIVHRDPHPATGDRRLDGMPARPPFASPAREDFTYRVGQLFGAVIPPRGVEEYLVVVAELKGRPELFRIAMSGCAASPGLLAGTVHR
jgi:hypothetical protein